MGKFFGIITGFVGEFFSFKKLFSGTRIAIVYAINFFILSMHIGICTAFLLFLLKFYFFVNSLIDYINSLKNTFVLILHSLGFFEAFNSVFLFLSPFFIFLIWILSSYHFIKVADNFRRSYNSYNLARID